MSLTVEASLDARVYARKSTHVGVLDHNLPYQRMIRKVTTSRYDMERIPVQLPHP